MPAGYTEADRAMALSALTTHGNKQAAADAIGWTRAKIRRVLDTVPEGMVPVANPLPPEDIPFNERFEIMKRRNAVRIAHMKAQEWQTIRVPVKGSYGLTWFGDPHMDDPFCDLAGLERHAKIVASTEAMYGVNGGDSINNWVGFLKKLYAEQSATATEGWELVDWFLNDCGITWLLWLLGNHDAWEHGARIFDKMNTTKVLMRDWDARVRLVSPDGGECTLWARHNFKGTSIYNELHGLKRAAMFSGGAADILAAFHLHTFGIGQYELENGKRCTLLRARGYKDSDHYALVNGFHEGRDGQSVATIITPRKGTSPIITPFDNVEEAADFLTYKRRKEAA
jgi:hypothetical protein